MSVFDASIFEPIYAGWTADSVVITADALEPTADGGPLQPAADATDAGVNAHIYDVDIYEPVGRLWSADSVRVTADSIVNRADGSPAEGARDTLDAAVIAAELPVEIGGGVRPFKPYPVVGYGLGYLPPLWGEAFGTVGVIGGGSGEVEFDEDELVIALMMALDEAA